MEVVAAPRDDVVGVGVGVVPPERRPWRRPLFLLLPGRAGRRGRGGGLESAAMRTPAAARTTAKPRGGGAMTDCGDAHAGGGEDNGEAVGGGALTGKSQRCRASRGGRRRRV